jgi:hypothetical protein
MHKFGFSDSVLDVAKAVLDKKKPEELEEAKMPRQMKDPKKETLMAYPYKPGKARVQVVDKKDVKDKEKKGYVHAEEVEEDAIAEAMEMHVKMEPGGTHYKVHKVGKKLAAHGGIKVGERLSDTEMDDARESGIRVRHVKEGAMKRIATQAQLDEPGSGLETFKKMNAKKNGNGMKKVPQNGSSDMNTMKNEAADIDDENVDKALKHDCASHVVHKEHGEGQCIPGMHTIVETEDGQGYVTHYDIMFGSQIVEDVPVEELEIVKEMSHGHPRKKKMKMEAHQGKKHLDPVGQEDDDVDNDGDTDSSDKYLKKRRKAISKAIKNQEETEYELGKLISQEAHEMSTKGKCPETDALGGKKMNSSAGVATVSEDAGDEKVRSSAQAGQLAKHYYMKAKQAQQSGSKEQAAKMMSVAKKFYRKSESDASQEKGGRAVGAAEGWEVEDLGPGEIYFNELEIQELEAAEDIVSEELVQEAPRKGGGAKVGESERSGHRVTKTEKEGPEHIVMQLRKVVSVGKNHGGVHFQGGKSKSKVDPGTAQKALSRYNSSKPAEKAELQKHMDHSHDALKHVASGGDLSKSPMASEKKSSVDVTQFKRHGVQSKSGHYN